MKTNLSNPKNYGNKRSTSNIKYLVYHYTANDGDTDEAKGNYFKNNFVGGSAHYFVDDDSVTQSVPDNYVAWSVGGSKYNDCAKTGGGKLYGIVTNFNSISVEMCDTKKDGKIMASEATLANAVKLGKKLMKKYNIDIDHVIRHFDVNGKHCPAYFMDESAWSNFKKRLIEKDSASKVIDPNKEKIDVIYQSYTKKNGWLSEITNYKENNGNGYSGLFGNPILGFRAKLKTKTNTDVHIEYRAHKKNGKWYSWRVDYKKDSSGDTFAGTCKSEIDGIQFRIKGAEGRHIKYRVHVVNKGWLGWIIDYGEGPNGYAGIYGIAIDGIQIKVL